jgi:hypothetical protein
MSVFCFFWQFFRNVSHNIADCPKEKTAETCSTAEITVLLFGTLFMLVLIMPSGVNRFVETEGVPKTNIHVRSITNVV